MSRGFGSAYFEHVGPEREVLKAYVIDSEGAFNERRESKLTEVNSTELRKTKYELTLSLM